MKKITLYRKGGKLYYKKGGKMCLYEGGGPIRFKKSKRNALNKYQPGGFNINLNDQPSFSEQYGNQSYGQNPYNFNNVLDSNESEVGKKDGQAFNTSNIGNYANLASMAMGAIPRTKVTYADNEIAGTALGSQKKKRESLQQSAKDISSNVPIWGAVSNATRDFGELINPEDEYGIDKSPAGTFFQSVIDPGSSIAESIALEEDGWTKAGNVLTFGLLGEKKKRQIRDKAINEQKYRDNRKGMFDQNVTGRSNTGMFAKYGADIRTLPYNTLNNDYNAEIENGELVLGENISSLKIGGDARASMVSPYAAKIHGDKHGQDTDGDGYEGIPVKAEEGMYIASNFLGLDGKRAGKGKKTVAKEMEPVVNSLAKAEKGGDAYSSNPELIKHQLTQLEVMKNEAETNKAAEELKKMLGKKDRNMSEIAQFIQDNAEYLLGQAGTQPTNPSSMPQMAQKGGKIIGDIRDYAREKGASEAALRNSRRIDPEQFQFDNNQQYVSKEGDVYDVDSSFEPEDDEAVINQGFEETSINPATKIIDERQGGTANETTLGQQAGTSKYTGTSLLIQEKMEEVLDENIFTEDGKLSSEWIEKGVQSGIPRNELMNAQRKTITEGPVGKWLGKEMERAFGVQSVGKDEQGGNVDSQVTGRSQALYNNEKLNWVADIINDVKSNNGIIPSKYSNLPEDLLDEVTRLARTGKAAHEGSFGSSLTDAFTKANQSVATETDRVESYGYESDEASGFKIDKTVDLANDPNGPKVDNFSAAFRWARENLQDEPYFTYKGKRYSKKTRSEDPELAKASDETAALAGKAESQAKLTKTIQPKEIEMRVQNPRARLKRLAQKRRGGMIYQQGGMIDVRSMDDRAISKAINDGDIETLKALQKAGRLGNWNVSTGEQRTSSVPAMNTAPSVRMQSQPMTDASEWSQYVGNKIGQAQERDERIAQEEYRKSLGLAPRFGDRPIKRRTAGQEASATSGIKQGFRKMGGEMNSLYQRGYRSGGQYGSRYSMMNDQRILEGYQMGGEMPEQEMQPGAESSQMAQQMMAQNAAQDPNATPMDENNMSPEDMAVQGQMPAPIAQLPESLQQIFMSLPPEMQNQVLQLPPDQIPVAIQAIAQQMQGSQQAPNPGMGAPAQQAGPSPVPQEVVDQMR